MSAKRLLEQFHHTCNAPDAIPRLRRFILDLAVRGKLVLQNPSDEPASDLLGHIAEERLQLAKAGQIRNQKAISTVIESDIPFSIPQTWCWSRIAEIGVLSPRNNATDDTTASFVPMPMISAAYGVANAHEVRLWGEIKKGYTHFAEGDVALAKITPCFENGKSMVVRNLTGGIGAGTTELHVVRPLLVDPEYILIFLKCPYFIETGIPRMTGTAGQKRVPFEYFANSPLPLPPLAEQRCIVAKVDELMALCDQLEVARAEREAMRDRLTAASLARLNAPDPDAAVFASHARFACNNLAAVTTRPDQVKHFRQTILNLAVRGSLAPQDPNDEPASELLKRIAAEKARLMRDRQLRPQAQLPEIHNRDEPFASPQGWEWCRLGGLCYVITDGAHHTPKYEAKGIPFLSVKDVSGGTIDLSDTRFISEAAHRELCKRCKPEIGDILLTKVGTTGIAVTIDVQREFSIFVSLALLKFSQADLDGRFLALLINSPLVKQQSAASTQGIGNKNLVLRLIKLFRVPIPPLAEQHRIVAKVDELMALCDQLEATLDTCDVTRSRLLDALVAEALSPGRRDLAAA